MEVKKSPKASLENKKLLFVEIGLVIALRIHADHMVLREKLHIGAQYAEVRERRNVIGKIGHIVPNVQTAANIAPFRDVVNKCAVDLAGRVAEVV